MKLRREEVRELLEPNEDIFTLTNLPRVGCPNSCYPPYTFVPKQTVSGSLFLPDETTFDHPRFFSMVSNIRARRGRKVTINVPVLRDLNTADPFIDDTIKEDEDFHGEAKAASKLDHVYLDSTGFSTTCCLQVTFQTTDMEEALLLYDQLTPLCPLMMSLSASTPVQKGLLTDHDHRWSIISPTVDDRTVQESGEAPIYPHENVHRIFQSRYSAIESYVGPNSGPYNDIPLVYNEDDLQLLLESGVPDQLARHIAHLFIRDPVILYREKVEETLKKTLESEDDDDTELFENIQSSNWLSMRLKPPPKANSSIGWRVEFRPMDTQLSDFENTAYVVFIVLLTRLILSYKMNLLIPMSKVHENFAQAEKRDSVRRGRFWFRREMFGESTAVLMTVDEIFNGSKSFPGLIPLLKCYLLTADIEAESHIAINEYLQLISNRASGAVPTVACWIRSYIQVHPKYQKDSRVTEEICYDLLNELSSRSPIESLIRSKFTQ